MGEVRFLSPDEIDSHGLYHMPEEALRRYRLRWDELEARREELDIKGPSIGLNGAQINERLAQEFEDLLTAEAGTAREVAKIASAIGSAGLEGKVSKPASRRGRTLGPNQRIIADNDASVRIQMELLDHPSYWRD